VWLGLQRLYLISLCWETFGPEAKELKPTGKPKRDLWYTTRPKAWV